MQNPTSQFRECDSGAGEQPADVTVMSSGLFTAEMSIQVQAAPSLRQLSCCYWRDEETPDFCVHDWPTDIIGFSASALFVMSCPSLVDSIYGHDKQNLTELCDMLLGHLY